MIQLDDFFAWTITDACAKAVEVATERNEPARFVFNGTEVIANPGDDPKALEAKWHANYLAAAEAYRNSPEYKESQRRYEEEEHRKATCSMKETAQLESDMRDAKVPTPYTLAQLTEYIESLLSREHDYGTCVYAMSMAATAAFNHVAHVLGVTGFQASCADLDVLRRTRRLDGPFILLKGRDALYPQYDLLGKLTEAMQEWRPWLKEQAEKNLAEKPEHVHPEVLAHWKRLSQVQ